MRFRHQVHEIRVPLSPEDTAESLVARFFASYEQAFGRGSAVAGSPTEIVTFHLVSTLPAAACYALSGRGLCACTHLDARRVLRRAAHRDSRVRALADLAPGARLEGPLIVESPNTTVVVHGGQAVEVDGYSNLGIAV